MSDNPDRNYRVVARNTRTDEARQVFRKKRGFTRNPDAPGSRRLDNPHLFTKEEAKDAVKWGLQQNPQLAVFYTTARWPFVVRDVDTAWANDELMDRLNELGKKRKRYLWAGELRRTNHRQWELRQAYVNGHGALAAQCCWIQGAHSWNACGKQCRSMHCIGEAGDVSVLHSGRSGSYTNVGNDPKANALLDDVGLWLAVPGEAWHVQRR